MNCLKGVSALYSKEEGKNGMEFSHEQHCVIRNRREDLEIK